MLCEFVEKVRGKLDERVVEIGVGSIGMLEVDTLLGTEGKDGNWIGRLRSNMLGTDETVGDARKQDEEESWATAG